MCKIAFIWQKILLIIYRISLHIEQSYSSYSNVKFHFLIFFKQAQLAWTEHDCVPIRDVYDNLKMSSRTVTEYRANQPTGNIFCEYVVIWDVVANVFIEKHLKMFPFIIILQSCCRIYKPLGLNWG